MEEGYNEDVQRCAGSPLFVILSRSAHSVVTVGFERPSFTSDALVVAAASQCGAYHTFAY